MKGQGWTGHESYPCTVSNRQFIRDGRAPIPKDVRTSLLMSRIRSRNTKPELALRKALRSIGLVGYRANYSKAPGKPDIAFVGLRIAVFVHGCYWHSCPHCSPRRPKTNVDFWRAKLDRNKERDARKARDLRKSGWKVLVVWECMIRKNVIRQAQRVARVLNG